MKKQHKLLVVVLVLALASLACSVLGSGGGNQAPEVPAPPETTAPSQPGDSGAAPEPTAPTEGDSSGDQTDPGGSGESDGGDSSPPQSAGADTLNLDDPNLFSQPVGVDTYRTRLENSFDGLASDGSPVTGTILVEGETIVDPFASALTFFSAGDAIEGTGETYVYTQIGETTFFTSPDAGCIAGNFDAQNDPFEIFLDVGGFLTGEAQRLLPDETVNGLDVYVYEITQDNLESTDADPSNVDQLKEGRIYIAKEGFFVVRLLLEGSGLSDVLSSSESILGDIFYELNYFDFNQPVGEIMPPEGCQSVEDSTTFPYPMLDDATEVNVLAGVGGGYLTGSSLEEVADFYREQMANEGWTLTSESSTPPIILQTYSKEGETVNFTFAPDSDDPSKTLVAYFITP